MTEYSKAARPFRHGHRWGIWMLDAERLCLCAVAEGVSDPRENFYEIELDGIGSPYWILDWMDQLSPKTWVTPDVMGQFTMAMLQLFRPRDRMKNGTTARVGTPKDLLARSIDRDWGDA